MVQGSLAGDGWANYAAVLAVPGLWRFFLNTVVIAAGVIAIVYVVTMLAAYGFGTLRIRGRDVYFWLLLACLTLPEVVLLTPLFTTAQASGFFDTYWAVILPLAALQVPFPSCSLGPSSTGFRTSCSRRPGSTAGALSA